MTKFTPTQEQICEEIFQKKCQISFKQQGKHEQIIFFKLEKIIRKQEEINAKQEKIIGKQEKMFGKQEQVIWKRGYESKLLKRTRANFWKQRDKVRRQKTV